MLYLILIVCTLKFQRVKVYRLNDDGKWDDQGTGHVTVDYLEVCDWLFPLLFVLDWIRNIGLSRKRKQ